MSQFSATRGEWRMQLCAPPAPRTPPRGRDSRGRTPPPGALDLLKRRGFDLVLVDLYMSQVDGLMLLRTALGTNRDTIVIVMTGNPSVESSVEALRQGAFDYLPKPFTATHLQVLIGRAVHTLVVARETSEQRTQLERRHAHSDKITLLGTAPAFQRAIELARKVAPTDASVFITGESGSGKELIAQFIHHNSRRSSRPFVAVNCAAPPEGHVESEKIRTRKGGVSGAVRDKPGLLEAAHGDRKSTRLNSSHLVIS